MKQGAVIGIDLGTTFSSVAYVDASGHVICLPNRAGQTLTPSVVYLKPDGQWEVGTAARAALTCDPERVATGFKRRLGPKEEPYRLRDRTITGEELSAIVLERLIEDARHALGDIAGAVITVPAYFGDVQRTATLNAARRAGIPVLELLNEPTAAALAHAFDAYLAAGGDPGDLQTASIAATAPAISVICDLGGGTFDITIIRINGSRFDVLATGGSLSLGGRDWDQCIVDLLERHILQQGGSDPHHDPKAQARMWLDAESAKHVLSVRADTQIAAPYPNVPPMTLTRQRFEEITEVLADRVETIVQHTMVDAGLTWPEIEDVLLVGGSTRMPHIRRRIESLSGMKPNTRLQPDLAVAQGAAVYAAILRIQGAEKGLTAKSPGTSHPSASQQAQAGPASVSAGKSGLPASDEQDLVAFANVSSDVGELLYEDAFAEAAGAVRLTQVNARSLGVIVRSPRYDKLVNAVVIPRNSPIRGEFTRRFVTRQANQRRIRIPIVEGEGRNIAETTEIGMCMIDDLPPGLPAGSQVQVTFSFDASGRVCVLAKELTTGRFAQTVIDRCLVRPATQLDELALAVAELKG